MADFSSVLKRVFGVEHSGVRNILHKNKTENSYTFYGIFPYTKLKSYHKIEDAIRSTTTLQEASELLSKDKELYKEVEGFYWINFWMPMQLHKVNSDHKAAEILCFIINTGIGRKTKVVAEIQRLVGTVQDGILGEKTIEALNVYSDDEFDVKFDKWEIMFYEELVKNNPKLKIYSNGWRNRAALI